MLISPTFELYGRRSERPGLPFLHPHPHTHTPLASSSSSHPPKATPRPRTCCGWCRSSPPTTRSRPGISRCSAGSPRAPPPTSRWATPRWPTPSSRGCRAGPSSTTAAGCASASHCACVRGCAGLWLGGCEAIGQRPTKRTEPKRNQTTNVPALISPPHPTPYPMQRRHVPPRLRWGRARAGEPGRGGRAVGVRPRAAPRDGPGPPPWCVRLCLPCLFAC